MRTFIARCTPWGTIQIGIRFHALSALEKQAVIAHEEAHLAHFDPWIRMWWLLSLQLLFRPDWVFARAREQEFAADRAVKDKGLGSALASFLRRHPQSATALHPSSQERLEALHV